MSGELEATGIKLAALLEAKADEVRDEMGEYDRHRGTVRSVSADGKVEVDVDGGDTIPCSTSVKCLHGDRVVVERIGSTATVVANLTKPATDDAFAENAFADLVMQLDEVRVDTGRFDEVFANDAAFHVVVADDATFEELEAAKVKAEELGVDVMAAKRATVDMLKADSAEVESLNASAAVLDRAAVADLKANNADIAHLRTGKADIDAANIASAAMRDAWIDKLMVQSGLIAHEGAVYTLDAVQVNASSIKAGTIDVDRLIVTVDGEKYVVHVDTQGAPSYQKLDGGIIQDLTITADKLVAGAVTAQKITAENLVGSGGWINLRNGTFSYTNADTGDGISWDGQHLSISASSVTVAINDALQEASGAKAAADAVAALVRQYGDGVLVCRQNQSVGALVNANGSFDVVSVTWEGGEPTAGGALATFAEGGFAAGRVAMFGDEDKGGLWLPYYQPASMTAQGEPDEMLEGSYTGIRSSNGGVLQALVLEVGEDGSRSYRDACLSAGSLVADEVTAVEGGRLHDLSSKADASDAVKSIARSGTTFTAERADGTTFTFTQRDLITGVKGNAESAYRTGNVNLTPANIGAAASGHTHSYLPLSGGTLTGVILFKCLSAAVTGGSYSDFNPVNCYDSAGDAIGQVRCGVTADKRAFIGLVARQTVGGSIKQNMLGVYTDASGDATYNVPSPASFRSAISAHVRGTTLYDNASGSNGTITLSQSVNNFDFLEVWTVNNNGNLPQCQTVPTRKGAVTTDLFHIECSSATSTYIRRTRYAFSGTSMKPSLGSYVNFTAANTFALGAASNYIKVTRVIGYTV